MISWTFGTTKFWLKKNFTTNIRLIHIILALRIRPITNEDTVNLPTRFQRQVLTASAPNQVVVQADKKQVFNYDFVFGPEATQQDVYDKAIVKLVDNFLEGMWIFLIFDLKGGSKLVDRIYISLDFYAFILK